MSGDCGCGCGGAAKVAPLTGAGFVRPRFFGGMLLTEDDLQAAVEYTVAKRKLTNRHVIGAGVVCGLDVTPHPCEDGVVVVSPGYAIECCGNDILVSCSEDVDILGLVRDLRRRTGVDCGEPCDKQPAQEYHLYIRYAETPTAPVAPYAQTDCATGECEFSRISEGYRFELRCDGPDDIPSLLDAVRACRPPDNDTKVVNKKLTDALVLYAKRSQIAERIEVGEAAPKVPAAGDFKAVLVDADKPETGVRLTEGVALVSRSLAVFAHDAVAARGGQPPSRRDLVTRMEKLAEQLRSSPELAKRPEAERGRILRVLETAEKRPDFSGLSPIDRGWLEAGTSESEADREFSADAEAVRSIVLRRLEERRESGLPEYREIAAMRFDRIATVAPEAVRRLGRTYLRTLDACTCSAFNPPCPTCTDDAVALAKVRVDDCKVVEVCALDRRWVLSPRALGYWIPVVEALREQLEKVCCGEDRGQGKDASAYGVAAAAVGDLGEQLLKTRPDDGTRRQIDELERRIAELEGKGA